MLSALQSAQFSDSACGHPSQFLVSGRYAVDGRIDYSGQAAVRRIDYSGQAAVRALLSRPDDPLAAF